MNATATQTIGGLVLKRKDLETILAETGTVGVAFALKEPGKSKNVGLKVMRVYAKDNDLISEERTVQSLQGAISPLRYPSGSITDFKYHHLDKLKEDKFSFGFFSKDSFERLKRDGWDEVFIGGGIKNYGYEDFVDKPNWFSFTIAMRKNIPMLTTDAVKASELSINLKPYASQGIVTVDMLNTIVPDTFALDSTIASIVLDKNKQYVKGLVFENDKTLFFDSQQPVSSVLLTEDQTLRKIYLDTSERINILNIEVAEESNSLGGYPLSSFTIGCPPHWYQFKVSLQEEEAYNNTVKEAIEVALK